MIVKLFSLNETRPAGLVQSRGGKGPVSKDILDGSL